MASTFQYSDIHTLWSFDVLFALSFDVSMALCSKVSMAPSFQKSAPIFGDSFQVSFKQTIEVLICLLAPSTLRFHFAYIPKLPRLRPQIFCPPKVPKCQLASIFRPSDTLPAFWYRVPKFWAFLLRVEAPPSSLLSLVVLPTLVMRQDSSNHLLTLLSWLKSPNFDWE